MQCSILVHIHARCKLYTNIYECNTIESTNVRESTLSENFNLDFRIIRFEGEF